MTEGNISRCIRYVRRLVWYAPDVTASATSMAFCRISTRRGPLVAGSSQAVVAGPPGDYMHSPLLPFRIM